MKKAKYTFKVKKDFEYTSLNNKNKILASEIKKLINRSMDKTWKY